MSYFQPRFVTLAGFGGCLYAVLAEKFRRNFAKVNAQPCDEGDDGDEFPQFESDCPTIFEDVSPKSETPETHTPPRHRTPRISSPKTSPFGGSLFHPTGEAAALTPPDPWERENIPLTRDRHHTPRPALRPVSYAAGLSGLPSTPERPSRSTGGLSLVRTLDFNIHEDDDAIEPIPFDLGESDKECESKSKPAFTIFEDTDDETVKPSFHSEEKSGSPLVESVKRSFIRGLPPKPTKLKPQTPTPKSVCPIPEKHEPEQHKEECEIPEKHEPEQHKEECEIHGKNLKEKDDWRSTGIVHKAIVVDDFLSPPRHQSLVSPRKESSSPPWSDETPKADARTTRRLSFDEQTTPKRADLMTPDKWQQELPTTPKWSSDMTQEAEVHHKPPMSPRHPRRGPSSPSWALASPVADRHALQPLKMEEKDLAETEPAVVKKEKYSFLQDPTERLSKYPDAKSGKIFPLFEIANRSVIHLQDFLLCYDNQTKSPVWTLELVTKDNVKPMNWYPPSNRVDGKIEEEFRSDVDDYRSVINKYKETNVVNVELHQDNADIVCQYSNVTPQATGGRPHTNRTLWNELHDYVVHLTEKHKNLWILSGVLYSPEITDESKKITKYEVIGDNKVSVPTHFFKVILAPIVDKTHQCRYRLECYMFKNEFTNDLDLRHYHVPRCNLEHKAGFLIFDVIDDTKVSIKDTDQEFIEKKYQPCTQD